MVIPLNIALYGAGVVCGIVPCLIWGKMGGDEGFKDNRIRPLLKLTHHWHLGAIIMVVGYFVNPYVFGWGVGTAVDDLLFHSYENYFKRS